MRLADLPTPCLVLDRGILLRNIATMGAIARRHAIALRPHLKTAKSIEVARLAIANQPGGITVSTLAEAEYFAAHGMIDILYAIGVTPEKLEPLARLRATGSEPIVVTDDRETAVAIAAQGQLRALIEIDTGEARGGLLPDDAALLPIAEALGSCFAGVMTHAGHSYAARTPAAIAAIAEAERAGLVAAAQRLKNAGFSLPIVSLGSSPTAVHGVQFDGATELRAGVQMFGDLFQAGLGTQDADDIALSVLTSVIGRRPASNTLLIDAGALALSKDRSTAGTPFDAGFGMVRAMDGAPALGQATVVRVYQEQGVVQGLQGGPPIDCPIGTKLRVLPNHACLTAAAHDRYYVVDGGDTVEAMWMRINGW